MMEALPPLERRGHTSSGIPLHDAARASVAREKQRMRSHASTQTTSSEIIPLKQVQSNLQRMWTVRPALALAAQIARVPACPRAEVGILEPRGPTQRGDSP